MPESGISPNPATSEIGFTLSNAQTTTYVITDLSGRTIAAGEAQNGSRANISALIPGMYLVTLQLDGGQTKTYKLIKE
jgi:hypothetical protein